MTRTHSHPCIYCETPLRCTGTPEYACGYEGAFCSTEAADPGAWCCDDCAEIAWCEMCGEIEVWADGVCAACVEDDDDR